KDRPSSVRTYVGGQMTLSASSEFAGNVYAPNANVFFNGNAKVFGSLFVNIANFGAAAEIHYDEAIRVAGAECPPGQVPQPDAGPEPDAGPDPVEYIDAGPGVD